MKKVMLRSKCLGCGAEMPGIEADSQDQEAFRCNGDVWPEDRMPMAVGGQVIHKCSDGEIGFLVWVGIRIEEDQ